MPLRTRLTELVDCRVPLVCAPMAGAAGGELAANVTRAGGFGFIAAGHTPLTHLKEQVAIARRQLGLTDDEPLPLGIGLLFWRLEPEHGNPDLADEFLSYIINNVKPKAIWLSFGQQLKQWVDKLINMTKPNEPRFKVFVGVYTTSQALQVATWNNVDVIAVQGTEAGGHGPCYEVGLPTMSAIPVIKQQLSSTSQTCPLLLAAGGISSGSQLLSALSLGSDGVVLGTLFLATPEALYNKQQKQLIVESKGEDTVRTMNFDYARGTLGWGQGVDGRGLRNQTSQLEKEVVDSEKGRQTYDDAVKQGDVNKIVTWSGTSVGLVDKIQPSADWVLEIERDALKALDRLNSFVD
ncbi:hypothetical protein OIO90_006104 [Microbotryomycetes sp. JL221]|nr:hypothetical protein OIO90_006104 [Microbotryomycetes sp. JL221]